MIRALMYAAKHARSRGKAQAQAKHRHRQSRGTGIAKARLSLSSFIPSHEAEGECCDIRAQGPCIHVYSPFPLSRTIHHHHPSQQVMALSFPHYLDKALRISSLLRNS